MQSSLSQPQLFSVWNRNCNPPYRAVLKAIKYHIPPPPPALHHLVRLLPRRAAKENFFPPTSRSELVRQINQDSNAWISYTSGRATAEPQSNLFQGLQTFPLPGLCVFNYYEGLYVTFQRQRGSQNKREAKTVPCSRRFKIRIKRRTQPATSFWTGFSLMLSPPAFSPLRASEFSSTQNFQNIPASNFVQLCQHTAQHFLFHPSALAQASPSRGKIWSVKPLKGQNPLLSYILLYKTWLSIRTDLSRANI